MQCCRGLFVLMDDLWSLSLACATISAGGSGNVYVKFILLAAIIMFFSLTTVFVFYSLTSMAAVKPNVLISDNAVLQQGISVPIWGTAHNGEKVIVKFQNQTVSTTAKDGRWMVRLKPLKPGGPFTMTISGESTIKLKNILVGEVWVCSGQSNMELGLSAVDGGDRAIAAAQDPMLRLFTVSHNPQDKPVSEVEGSWAECKPDSVRNFTAVGYYFGRDLRKSQNVPIGLIQSAASATLVEAWTSKRAVSVDTDLQNSIDKLSGDWKLRNTPCALYNGMIAPLQPYAIRGVIWYQGEKNVGQANQYEKKFTSMIRNWREDWGEGDFPFLFVQLAPFMKIVSEPEESKWAELREAQLKTSLHCPNTAMAVITDAGDPDAIHPRKKEPVGSRLALAARSLAYGEKVVSSSPLYKSLQIKGDRALLSFTNIGSGLVAKDGDLKGFTIAGADKKWHNARATIQGNKIAVSSPDVPNPIAVRYGWANCPVVNLYNKEGLPASPFRTDRFDITSGSQQD